MENLFLSRLQTHIFASPNFNPYQSAHRRNRSTETALLCILDHSANIHKSTNLVYLDVSAAFDTIDHHNLLHRGSKSLEPLYNPLPCRMLISTNMLITLNSLSLSLNPQSPNLESTLAVLSHWFALNCLALNPDKSDAILLGTRQRNSTLSNISHIIVAG